ncbi:cytochrome c oxidase copper chaperone-like [Podarcis raffonei]|uniref:cytochrome c oxidase copper chaperone-like n=1 Tax=Podarcis raffonei TaxID=65483 RepID=UPI0023292434|nr:cytochrome c oxidase copper chaperone-like [Podarcis raffonei]
MSESHSNATAEGQGTPDPTTEEPPCAELKAASEKCIKEKGGEACKELLEAYHSCLRALGMAHQDLEANPLPPSH